VFHIVLEIKSDFFPKHHYPVGPCSGDVMCFLWGLSWICILSRVRGFAWLISMGSGFDVWIYCHFCCNYH
jgi:hypothetical protein